MNCINCKYKRNLGSAIDKCICTYAINNTIVQIRDACRFFPKQEKLKCGDCTNLYEDAGCFGCRPEESAIMDGKLCDGFSDRKEEDMRAILAYWKSRGIYDRKRIDRLIDDFEAEYSVLLNSRDDSGGGYES